MDEIAEGMIALDIVTRRDWKDGTEEYFRCLGNLLERGRDLSSCVGPRLVGIWDDGLVSRLREAGEWPRVDSIFRG